MTTTITLTKNEKTIIDGYLNINRIKGSMQSQITALCEKGKSGQESIIKMAQYLMIHKESTATLKVQVSRAMAKLKTGLSLQGVGKKDNPKDVTIAPKQKEQGGSGNGKGDKDTESKATSITSEQVWDFVVERFTREELKALVEEYNKQHKDTQLKVA